MQITGPKAPCRIVGFTSEDRRRRFSPLTEYQFDCTYPWPSSPRHGKESFLSLFPPVILFPFLVCCRWSPSCFNLHIFHPLAEQKHRAKVMMAALNILASFIPWSFPENLCAPGYPVSPPDWSLSVFFRGTTRVPAFHASLALVGRSQLLSPHFT